MRFKSTGQLNGATVDLLEENHVKVSQLLTEPRQIFESGSALDHEKASCVP